MGAGAAALPAHARSPSLAPGEPLPVGRARRRDAPDGGPPARRRSRPVRALLRRPRARGLPAPRGCAARARQAALATRTSAQLIIERELGDLIRALRRAPGASPSATRSATASRSIPAGSRSSISKPALADAVDAGVGAAAPAAPVGRVHGRQPGLRASRRVLHGVARVGIDVERLRRYAFISERGLTLYEPGVAALEGFLRRGASCSPGASTSIAPCARSTSTSARCSSRAIEALFGDDSPADRLADYVDLDEYALLHQAARWARGEDVRADGERGAAGAVACRAPSPMAGAAILLRRPGWRAEAEMRASYEAGAEPTAEIARLGTEEPGQVAIDLAVVDARPASDAPARDRGPGRPRDSARGGAVAGARLRAHRAALPARVARGRPRRAVCPATRAFDRTVP